MAKFSLIGPSAEWRATEGNPRKAVNWFVHVDDTGGKEKLNWVGTPGTSLNKALAGLARGFHVWGDTSYLVIGAALYSYDGTTLAAVTGGTLQTSTGYVSMAHSPDQLLICDGSQHMYIWDGTTFTEVGNFSTYVNLDSAATIVIAERVVQTEDSDTVVVSSGVATITCAAAHLAYPGNLVWLRLHGESDLNVDMAEILTTPSSTQLTVSTAKADGTYNDSDYTCTFLTASVTCLTEHNASVGDLALISGMLDATLNDTWTINAITSSTVFTFNTYIAAATYLSDAATAAIYSDSLLIAPDRCTYMDGYFVVNNSRVADDMTAQMVFYSALGDGRIFTATRFLEPQRDPDATLVAYANAGNLVLLGTQSTELWFNPGTSDIDPFEPARSAAIPWGVASPWTVTKFAEGIAWVGRKDNSSPVVVVLDGYAAKKISSPPVEKALKDNAASLLTATAYAYVDEGHDFYVLTIGTQTWVYDAATELWHERQSWNGTTWAQHRGRWYGYLGGKHLVTDHTAGNLLELNLGTFTDYVTSASHSIRRLGRSGYVGDTDKWLAHRKVHIDMAHPLTSQSVLLKWSDDGGHTWTDGEIASVSGYETSVEWWRLGASTARVYELTTEMDTQSFIVGAFAEVGT